VGSFSNTKSGITIESMTNGERTDCHGVPITYTAELMNLADIYAVRSDYFNRYFNSIQGRVQLRIDTYEGNTTKEEIIVNKAAEPIAYIGRRIARNDIQYSG